MTAPPECPPLPPLRLEGLAAIDTAPRFTLTALATELLGATFGADSWRTWRVIFRALDGLTLSDEERAIFQRFTGRTTPPLSVRELWCIIGRRGGKSLIAALIAVWLSTCRHYRLGPGEVGILMVLASDRKQARVCKRYIAALLRAHPILEALIAQETAETIELTNGITIEIATAGVAPIRGYTVIGCVLDELAYWPTEDAANPDAEVIAALKPAMATTNGLLVVISSPYARKGELWRTYRKCYGQDDSDVLVVKGDTLSFNPTVPADVVQRAYAEDESVASAEFGGEFRRDIEAFITREAVEACVIPDRRELPFVPGVRYFAFVDPSGGSSDSMTVAIGHRETDGRILLDAVREVRPPFAPTSVVEDFAGLLKDYHVTVVYADRYAGEWPREAFLKHGIVYKPSEKVKSDLYRDFLPLINAKQIELLDLPRLVAQAVSLERKTSRAGRDSIAEPPGSHDDVINAVAGVASYVRKRQRAEADLIPLGPPHPLDPDLVGGFVGRIFGR